MVKQVTITGRSTSLQLDLVIQQNQIKMELCWEMLSPLPVGKWKREQMEMIHRSPHLRDSDHSAAKLTK